MQRLLARYAHWLHLRWPAGVVERLPEAAPNGTTAVAGVRIVGDLTGIPLLKFAADSGARAVQRIVAEPGFAAGRRSDGGGLDLAIVGGGVSGIAAALEAREHGLEFRVFESTQPFSTVIDFPRAKPIYTYPTTMTPAGPLQVHADIKERLVDELETQRVSGGIEPVRAHVVRLERRGDDILLHGEREILARARRVIVAIGRSGSFRKLGVPGEQLDKVYNRLHDPMDFAGRQVLVVGGGDSAVEAAIALASAGVHVVLSHRSKELSRPKPENLDKLRALVSDPAAPVAVERPTSERVTTATTAERRRGAAVGSLRIAPASRVVEIRPDAVRVRDAAGAETVLANDVVFTMIGRDAPLDFFRRSQIPIRGERGARQWLGLAAFVALCCFVYTWKAGGAITRAFAARGWFPFNVRPWLESWSAAVADPASLLGTLAISLREPSFYYSLAYTLCIVGFGIDRMRRRRTPYVRAQTATLMAFQ